MDSEQVRIEFSVEPDYCLLRLAGALGVEHAAELRQTALELHAYGKNVRLDWSGAAQLDASIAQVLLSLAAGLRDQNRSLSAQAAVPQAVEMWLRTAGLWEALGKAPDA